MQKGASHNLPSGRFKIRKSDKRVTKPLTRVGWKAGLLSPGEKETPSPGVFPFPLGHWASKHSQKISELWRIEKQNPLFFLSSTMVKKTHRKNSKKPTQTNKQNPNKSPNTQITSFSPKGLLLSPLRQHWGKQRVQEGGNYCRLCVIIIPRHFVSRFTTLCGSGDYLF